jgi:hypothetical protein
MRHQGVLNEEPLAWQLSLKTVRIRVGGFIRCEVSSLSLTWLW